VKGRLVRLVVGLGLTALALYLANPSSVLKAAAMAKPGWIAAAILLVIPDRALMAYRWLVLLRPFEAARRLPRTVILRIFFVSTFVGTFLPSVGGDAARAVSLARHGVSVADSAASVFMDRLAGVWSLLLLALAGLGLVDATLRADTTVSITVILAAAVCACAALVVGSDRVAGLVTRGIALMPFAGAQRVAQRLLESVRRYRNHRTVLVNVTIGSVAVQIIRALQSYCIGRGLGIDAPLVVYIALIPVILLVMLVPVTINGIGTSQLAFVWLFGRVGVPSPQAFALSVIAVSLGIVGNLPGGILYALGGPSADSAPPRTARSGS
jgi:glycosyltransferase 2 family protein